MTQQATITWAWRAWMSPPPAKAAVAWGEHVRPLVGRLGQAMAGGQAARWSVCAGRDLMVVFGEHDALPWVEGLRYAAPSGEDAMLWLPTLVRPDVSHDLLAQAVARQSAGRRPVLLWNEPAAIVPLDRQVPLTAGWLAHFSAWLDAGEGAFR